MPITTTASTTSSSNNTMISLQAQAQNSATKTISVDLNEALTAHLPTVLGLKIKTNLQQNVAPTVTQQQQQQQQQQQKIQQQTSTVPQISTNPNSLLKQQLRIGLKDFMDVTIANASPPTNTLPCLQTATSSATMANTTQMETQEACSALQSLANVAERQAQNNIQPPSANNLHHQFLLHMAANPILKTSGEFFHQQNNLLMREDENNLDLLMDHSDKSDPEMLTLADENAGLDYSTGNETGGGQQAGTNEQLESSANSTNNNNSTGGSSSTTPRNKNTNGKPVQRRRIRRKAQSSLDDQAEQLTEMSVRGLDLFRYASINEGVYQCTECAKENMQKTFKNKYSFQRHAFLYHEGKHRKVFPCPLCGKEFSRPDKMKNHMKMTHESFTAKEIQNFNSLNYLITAAGEMQQSSSFPAPPPSSITQTQGNNVLNAPPLPQPTLLNQLQANNPALSIMINNIENNEEGGLNLTQPQQQPQQENIQDFNLPKPLKFPTDIEIKNEIIISPSPSPPPATATIRSNNIAFSAVNTSAISLAETLSLLKTSVQTTTTAQLNAQQRLEEVK